MVGILLHFFFVRFSNVKILLSYTRQLKWLILRGHAPFETTYVIWSCKPLSFWKTIKKFNNELVICRDRGFTTAEGSTINEDHNNRRITTTLGRSQQQKNLLSMERSARS